MIEVSWLSISFFLRVKWKTGLQPHKQISHFMSTLTCDDGYWQFCSQELRLQFLSQGFKCFPTPRTGLLLQKNRKSRLRFIQYGIKELKSTFSKRVNGIYSLLSIYDL